MNFPQNLKGEGHASLALFFAPRMDVPGYQAQPILGPNCNQIVTSIPASLW
jgi:hypothetical protein